MLRDVSFDVRAGEVICLIGPSGSGKSTVLRCINGLECHDGGVIRVDADPVSVATLPGIRRKVAMVFQKFNLFPHRTVVDNIIEGPVHVLQLTASEARKHALELLRSLADDGMTMIVVTHEMGFAREVADRVIFMDGGCVESGAARQTLNAPTTQRMRTFLDRVLNPL